MSALSLPAVRRVYDRIGPLQDWQAFYESRPLADLIAYADFESAHAIVELGCGTGRFAAQILSGELPAESTYVGLELSRTMTRLSERRLGSWKGRARVVLVEGQLPFPLPDASVDRFVANYMFDLLDDDYAKAMLAEAERLLTPGGRLCVVSLGEGASGVPAAVSRLWNGVFARWPALVGGCRPIDICTMLADQWEIEHFRSITTWGLTSDVVVAMRPR